MRKPDYHIICKTGGREQNQDDAKVNTRANLFQFIVADGLGGQGGGQVASQQATLSLSLDVVEDVAKSRDTDEDFSTESLRKQFEQAHQHLKSQQVENPKQSRMATTLVCLMIRDDKAIWGHAGDSRLYLFREGKIYHQSKDHSVPQMLLSSGEITPEEMRHHPDQNRLLRAVGDRRKKLQARIHPEEQLHEGDVFLLCSDGFWEYVLETEMCDSLQQTTTPSDWLVQMEQQYLLPRVERERIKKAQDKAENDNYTALAVWHSNTHSAKPMAMEHKNSRATTSLLTRIRRRIQWL